MGGVLVVLEHADGGVEDLSLQAVASGREVSGRRSPRCWSATAGARRRLRSAHTA